MRAFMFVHPRAALIVAHPGHELRLHHWLEKTHPTVFVLTDGSGATGQPRTQSTRALLERVGALEGSLLGPLTDEGIYRDMLECDVAETTAITLRLGNALAAGHFEVVVADPWEGYNPTHDVCQVVADLAVEVSEATSGVSIQSYTYDLTATTSSSSDQDVLIPVDEDAYQRKLASALAYDELRIEATAMLSAQGSVSMQTEILHPRTATPLVPTCSEKAWYETHGELRVAQGRYPTVLRYEQHVAPFLRALITSVRSSVESTLHEMSR
jgi:hypothetical protein